MSEINSVFNKDDLVDHDSACGIIFNENLEICVLFSNKYQKYTFPGGKKELNESLDDCLRRELFEEIGIITHEHVQLYSINKDYEREHSKVNVSIGVFLIVVGEGEPFNKETEKHNRLEWLTIDTLDKMESSMKCDNIRSFLKYLHTNKEVIPFVRNQIDSEIKEVKVETNE